MPTSIPTSVDESRLDKRLPDSTLELVRNLDKGIYEEAGRQGISAMQLLERHDPTDAHEGVLADTDVLQRIFMAAGLRTRSDVRTGEPASTLGDVYDAGLGVVVPAFIERTCRLANVFGTRFTRMRNPWGMYEALYSGERFYASNQPVSDVLRPNNLDSAIVAEALRASLLGQMVALDEQVPDAKPYQSFHLTYTAANSRLHRVTEGAPLPVYELTGSDRTFYMHEYGFEIQASYRVSSEWALPVMQRHLAFAVEQNNLDKEQVAYETIVNGDGTAAAATNTNVSALTSGVAGTVSYGNLREWLRLFEGNGNYYPTIAIGTSAVVHKVDISNFGTANYPTFGLFQALMYGQGGTPEERRFPPLYARSYATANKLAAWDASKSLRMRYTSTLEETDAVISNRYNKIAVSEYTGFSILIDGGRRTLDVEN